MVAATLFTLGGLAVAVGSEAILPAYLLGLAMATTVSDRADVLHKLRSTAFLLLTPFYFMKAGLYVSLPTLAVSLATVLTFLAVKICCQFAGVWPLTRALLRSVLDYQTVTDPRLRDDVAGPGRIPFDFAPQLGDVDPQVVCLLFVRRPPDGA